jgi:alginate O-acetyltransferase complex protein AlgJ
MSRTILWSVASTLLFFSCSGGTTEPPDATALFAKWSSLAQSAEQQETITVKGQEGWLFFGPELRHLGVGEFWGDAAAAVSNARRPEWADPLPAILDFHKQLSEAGVDLVIVPVPPKSIIYPDKLSSNVEPLPRLDLHHQAFYELLHKNGVNIVDLTPLFLSNREHPKGPLYCLQDTHWSGIATVLAAEQLAKGWFDNEPGATIQDEWRSVEIAGDLWRALDEPSVTKEQLPLRFVGTGSDGDLVPVEPDPSSPVVLLGDSHTLVFHAGGDLHAEGAGFADQLALELGFAVDLVGVRGSGATAARINLLRRAQRTPDYWSNKKLVIWCFSAREFTESDGWRIVPIGS